MPRSLEAVAVRRRLTVGDTSMDRSLKELAMSGNLDQVMVSQMVGSIGSILIQGEVPSLQRKIEARSFDRTEAGHV